MAGRISWVEEGIEQGLQQGLQQGRQEVKHQMGCAAMSLLEKRLGPLDSDTRESISRLDAEQLGQLIEAVLDFENIDQLNKWLDGHRS